jgi:hypothetical protein
MIAAIGTINLYSSHFFTYSILSFTLEQAPIVMVIFYSSVSSSKLRSSISATFYMKPLLQLNNAKARAENYV